MTDEQLFEQLISDIQPGMQRLHIPGVALGIIHGDDDFAAGFGITNLENPLPVNADTLFQVGSITKTVTATAMMRLVELGLVNLDAPILTYLPDLRLADESVERQVTLRHVFTHTSGWMGDYFDDAGPGDNALSVVVDRMHLLPQETPLGEIWSYNNAGFYLAGRVIEVITGKTYEAAARELVLDPLGMKKSFFFAQDVITHRVVAGHDAVFPGEERQPNVLRPWWLARASSPLGSLVSSVSDMLTYARFHMSIGKTHEPDGKPLLSPQSLTMMQSPTVLAANGEFMGISWFLRDVGNVRIVRHGGATNGQMATMQIVPACQFAIIALTNSDRGSELTQPLVRRAFEYFLGLTESVPEPLHASKEELAGFAGYYSGAAEDLQLVMSNDALVLKVIPKGGFPIPDSPPPPAPPPTRLALCGSNRVIALDEPFKDNMGEFIYGADGKLTWLRFGGRVHRLR